MLCLRPYILGKCCCPFASDAAVLLTFLQTRGKPGLGQSGREFRPPLSEVGADFGIWRLGFWDFLCVVCVWWCGAEGTLSRAREACAR